MNKKERPAELFGKRLRLSNENLEVMLAIHQLTQEKLAAHREDELEVAKNKTRFYS